MIITEISYEYDNYSGRNITLRLRDYNGSAPNLSYMVGHDVNITLNDLVGLKDKLHTPKEPTEPISQPENSIMGIDL
jgi:hypothetical protein